MKIVQGIELRYSHGKDLSFGELLKFYALIDAIKQFEKSYNTDRPKWYHIKRRLNGAREGRLYLTRLVDLLCNTKKPHKHIKKIPEIIKAIEFRKDLKEVKDPKSVLEQTRPAIIDDLIYQLAREELENLITQFKVKHDAVNPKRPKEKTPLQKEIEQKRKSLENIKSKVGEYMKPKEDRKFQPFKPVRAIAWGKHGRT
jgi:hypothetical protein